MKKPEDLKECFSIVNFHVFYDGNTVNTTMENIDIIRERVFYFKLSDDFRDICLFGPKNIH